MKTKVFVLTSLLITACAAPVHRADAVGKLGAFYRDVPPASCSAAFVAPNVAITAAHCLDNGELDTVVVSPGLAWLPVSVGYSDDVHVEACHADNPIACDLAVVVFDKDLTPTWFRLPDWGRERPERGYVTGYPAGDLAPTELAVAFGTTHGLLFQHDLGPVPGMSGGPVHDGVTVWGVAAHLDDRTAYAVELTPERIAWVRNFMDRRH